MPAIAIFGITGRMGQSLVGALRETEGFTLSGAIASPDSGRLGQDAAALGEPTGVLITADVEGGLRGAAVAVDFSLGGCVAEHCTACAAAGVPLLVGATGFDLAAQAVIERAAARIPVLIAPNTSVGVSMVAKLVSMAAQGLGPAYDVEIVETHHRMKRDAPSGTALALGQAVVEGRALAAGQQAAGRAAAGQAPSQQTLAGRAAAGRASLHDVAAFDRAARGGPRASGSIGFASVRAGDIVGEHTVIFAAAGERVEITHRATDRNTFARGALEAAGWLARQPAGLYRMQNVLGLR